MRILVSALVLGCSLSVAACSRSEAKPPAPTEAVEAQVVVFAASSLREAFSALAEDFEQAYPRTKVTLSFAGSQELRAQIEHGSPADVFASADQKHMEELAKATRVGTPVVFARNEPVLVVARENAASIRGLRDLPAASRIVLGAPAVPIGRYSLQLLERANATLGSDFRSRVEAKVVSRELNVRQVLAKVSLGEAAAGIVYRTDTISANDAVETVAIPADINVIAEYPAAVVADAAHPKLARAWIALLLSPAGQKTLAQAGFLVPQQGERAP